MHGAKPHESQMLRISNDEYRSRLKSLQASVAEAGLDLFIVSALESIYYLTGAGFEPLERPFFLLIRPRQAPILLVPKLEQEHMKKAHNIVKQDIRTYWDYPAPQGCGWPDKLHELIGDAKEIGSSPRFLRRLQLSSRARLIASRRWSNGCA